MVFDIFLKAEGGKAVAASMGAWGHFPPLEALPPLSPSKKKIWLNSAIFGKFLDFSSIAFCPLDVPHTHTRKKKIWCRHWGKSCLSLAQQQEYLSQGSTSFFFSLGQIIYNCCLLFSLQFLLLLVWFIMCLLGCFWKKNEFLIFYRATLLFGALGIKK